MFSFKKKDKENEVKNVNENQEEIKSKKKMKPLKKGLIIAGCSVVAIVAALGITVGALWGNELSSVCSIKKITEANYDIKAGPVYEMNVSGGYYFDKFIEEGGASNDTELINFIVDNITKGIIPISMKAPTIGCSSFTCVTEDGDRLFGRNYDFSQTTSMIVHTNPGGNRYSSISSVDLQFLGITEGKEIDGLLNTLITLAAPYAPLDGVNEKGVSCGIYMSYQGDRIQDEGEEYHYEVVATNQDTDKPDITSTTMLRMVLDYADSVESAVEMIKKYDLHDSASTSFHYMIADASGKSAILEWVEQDGRSNDDKDGSTRELKVYYNDDDAVLGSKEAENEFQYITNFIVTPDYYQNEEFRKDEQGKDRYDEIEKMINPDGTNTKGVVKDEAEALKILQTVGRRNWDKVNGETDGNGCTVWSALYNLTDKTVTWVGNEQFDNPNACFTFSL